MIPIMIQGLHPKMSANFIAVSPKTFEEFYSIAKKAEVHLKADREFFNKGNNFKTKFQPK